MIRRKDAAEMQLSQSEWMCAGIECDAELRERGIQPENPKIARCIPSELLVSSVV